MFKAVKAAQNWRIKLLAERHLRRAVKTARKRVNAAAAIETENSRALGGEQAEEDAAREAQNAAAEAERKAAKRREQAEEEARLNEAAEENASAAAADFAFDACSASLQERKAVSQCGCFGGKGVTFQLSLYFKSYYSRMDFLRVGFTWLYLAGRD